MRRKRLQHAADILCHMFCGWRLINSYRDLERLGSGILTIDALSEACEFEGRPLEPLSIAGELHAWLRRDLAEHNIDISQLREAKVTAELAFGSVPRSERVTRDIHFAPGGQHVVPARFLSCRIRCQSRVVTDEKVYTSEYEDLEEWPPGWPS